MVTCGEYSIGGKKYQFIMNHDKTVMEIVLGDVSSNTIVSAYKREADGTEACAFSDEAKKIGGVILKGVSSKKAGKQTPSPFILGVMGVAKFSVSKCEYTLGIFRGSIVSLEIAGGDVYLQAYYNANITIPSGIPYIELTKATAVVSDGTEGVAVRTVEEIALTKEDITWLQNKKYYIVNDDEKAEQIFNFLDNYNGVIAYDVETTGLRINMFGKVNSEEERIIFKYNEEHEEKLRVDKLVGIIFCVEKDVSYYFPCANRKFKNLYQSSDSSVRHSTINNIKARYTVGEFATKDSDMARYIRNTPADEMRLDVILMERVRNILTKKHIETHGGSFEWKVGWMFEIDTNIKDDTMIMHQLMYKFRSTTSNKGEPSNLKYLSKVELGVDQWELSDFFPGVDENEYGEVKTNTSAKTKSRKKKKSTVDFSYMDYDGTRIYAPADGDCTFCLGLKFKSDMMKNHRDIEYLYNVEVIVMCAIGYTEFYGHRINESKIESVREKTRAEMIMLESEIRQAVKYCGDTEKNIYDKIKRLTEVELDELSKEDVAKHNEELGELVKQLREAIDSDNEHPFNISAPAQVARLFYSPVEEGGLGYTAKDGVMSVAKTARKAMVEAKTEDGEPKYPEVYKYDKYKKLETLMTKFFDNLQYFMYPGGFIFSHYGQIAAATGRMNCSKPNAQQYPKAITKIVEPRTNFVMADADYSQIEYRVLTALAHNDWLAKLFSDPDSDYHTLMASIMYDVPYASVTPAMRGEAKGFNFGIPYGMGFRSLASRTHNGVVNDETIADAKIKYEMYFKNQPNTRKFFDRVKESATVNGYSLTYFNRRRDYTFTEPDGTVNGAKKAKAEREAGNSVIQGTAADIYKIAVARVFTYIRINQLIGLLLISNYIHDEQLFEINAVKLNVMRVLVDIGKCMQFHIDGFPPLYIGAGVGDSWGTAKGKMAEIHPNLLEEFTKQYENEPIFRADSNGASPKEITAKINEQIVQFRMEKIRDYLLNEENWHKDMHPEIGSMINLQFNFGRGGEAKAYVGPNGEKYTDEEFLFMNLTDFIDKYVKPINPNVTAELFGAVRTKKEEEEDKEYDDDEEYEEDIEFLDEAEYTLLSNDKVYGANVKDLIKAFGVCVLAKQKLCGINMANMYYLKKNDIIEYLADRATDEDDDRGLEVAFLNESNVLVRPGIKVVGVRQSELEEIYKRRYKKEATA